MIIKITTTSSTRCLLANCTAKYQKKKAVGTIDSLASITYYSE